MRRRTVPDNANVTTAVIFTPDAWSLSVAGSMAIATNTFSPMAAGRHSSGTPRGFSGDRGYGVNRMPHRLPYALQNFYSAVAPLAAKGARSKRLGAGAMPSGQPGLPNTGGDAGGIAALGIMSFSQIRPGMTGAY
jgi:hypothetical protein